MNIQKKTGFAALLAVVIVVSVASSYVTGYIINKNNTSSFIGQAKTPAMFTGTSVSAAPTDFTVAAEMSVHAVVHVKTKTPVTVQQYGFPSDPFFEYFFGRPQQRQNEEAPMQEGSGSGVIISADGYIVTNNHVIDKSKEIEVTLNDNRTFKAKLVGTDPNTDIALIKIDAENLPVITFGNSDALKVGEWVLAVGNPFNLTSTVTAGIVSAKARSINILNAPMKIEAFIQTDAAVNPGNSGGALVNTKGELVGINTAIASQTGSYAGYAFAVPVSIVQKVVSDIRQYGVVQRAVLGVKMGDVTDKLAKEKNLKTTEGAYIDQVVENSAAEKAGIQKEDVIVKVNDVDIKNGAQLQEQIGRYSPGDKVKITVLRGSKTMTFDVELKNRMGNTSVVSEEVNLDILGAEFKLPDEKLKNQLDLSYGVEVKSVSKGKFASAGIKSGFVIVKINNRAVRSVDDIDSILNDAMNTSDQFKVLSVAGIYPNGKIAYYTINLAE